MTTIPDHLLRQFLAGALEPPEAERVERTVRGQPGLQRRVAALLASGAPAEEEDSGWVLPPPAIRGLGGSLEPVATLDGAGASHRWAVLRFRVPPERAEDVVVVLERVAGTWEVLFPVAPEEVTPAGQLRVSESEARMDLQLDDRPHRLAVVLAPAEMVDVTAPAELRWRSLQARIRAGAISVQTWEWEGS